MLQWDKILSTNLIQIQIINVAQLASGFVTPIFMKTNSSISYIGKGWIPHIHHQLGTKIQFTIEIEDI